MLEDAPLSVFLLEKPTPFSHPLMGANPPGHRLHCFSEDRYVSPATVLVNRWAVEMAAIQKEGSDEY
jgi:hypothetical protein